MWLERSAFGMPIDAQAGSPIWTSGTMVWKRVKTMQITITRPVVVQVATPDYTTSVSLAPGDSYDVAVPEFTMHLGEYTLFLLVGFGCTLLPQDAWRAHRPTPSLN